MTIEHGELSSPMTVFDWVSLLWKLPYLVVALLSTYIVQSSPFQSRSALGHRQRLAVAATHLTTTTFNHRQLYAFLNRKTTGAHIRDYCKLMGISYHQVSVPLSKNSLNPTTGAALPPAKLHFVSVPDENPEGPTLLYFHGGGYLHAIVPHGHIPIGLHLAKSCKAARLVFLEYTLTPFSVYPGQLTQAVEATRYLMETEGVSADKLIIAGDSAGGHLTCSLLAHIVEPAPMVRPLDLGGKQLRAAVLISPWLDFTPESTSVLQNEKYDYLSQSLLMMLGAIFKSDAQHVWSEPINAPSAKTLWSRAFPKTRGGKRVVSRVIITAGEREVLLDSCVKFATEVVGAEKVYWDGSERSVDRVKQASAILVVGPSEVHVQCALDLVLRYRRGATVVAIKSFLEAV